MLRIGAGSVLVQSIKDTLPALIENSKVVAGISAGVANAIRKGNPKARHPMRSDKLETAIATLKMRSKSETS
jgi:hypothetical protein